MNKTLKVINSCETIEQLVVAERYAVLCLRSQLYHATGLLCLGIFSPGMGVLASASYDYRNHNLKKYTNALRRKTAEFKQVYKGKLVSEQPFESKLVH